jgi:hypothetical protein
MPDASIADATRSGCATVPASTTVVTPDRSSDTQVSAAEVSSSSGPWAA